MSAFKALRDVCKSFEEDLKYISKEIFSAKVDEPFEEVIVKRKKDLALYSSKLKLLQAKSIAVQPQIMNQQKTESAIITDYEDTAIWKVIEQQTVKTLVQTNAVKKLLSTPDRNLNPELIDRKEKIISQLTIYKDKESELRHLQTLLQEKETELLETRQKWDASLCNLKDVQKVPENKELSMGPLYKKLQVLISKMELMRWLITKLVTSRTSNYDWTSDPHKRLNALSLARKSHSIYNYIES